jgi:hypothetical protein
MIDGSIAEHTGWVDSGLVKAASAYCDWTPVRNDIPTDRVSWVWILVSLEGRTWTDSWE